MGLKPRLAQWGCRLEVWSDFDFASWSLAQPNSICDV
jgi:hypothetical protein